ncbi:MAG: hypothetical protein R3B13_03805 [Polyangiaceae bacterium]
MTRFGILCSALALATTGAARASADEPHSPAEKRYSVWQSKRHSYFLASASDVGIVYVRPHFTLGWGAPFWNFFGVDGYAVITNSFSAGYLGFRANLPFLDVQMGARTNYPYDRRLLPKQRSYQADDLPLGDGDERSTYNVIELEITPVAPLFGGVAFAEIHPMWFDTSTDVYLYEEIMRAVVVPPFAMRTRLGYIYNFGEKGRIKAGGMVEYMVTPGRPKNVTRVGPVFIAGLSDRYEILATVTLPVDTPDSLGIYEGSYGFVGLRGRFATRF